MNQITTNGKSDLQQLFPHYIALEGIPLIGHQHEHTTALLVHNREVIIPKQYSITALLHNPMELRNPMVSELGATCLKEAF